jgi:subtilisin family serine protease
VAAEVQPQARAAQAVPDQYIVVFKPGVADPPGLVRQFTAAHGLQVEHEYRYAVQGFAATIPAPAVDALRRNPNVEFIAPNLVYQLDALASAPTASAVTRAAPPAAPSNLALSVGSGRIDLTWQDNATDEKGMEVWRSTGGAAGSFGRYKRLRRDTETSSDEAVTDGVEHCYYIVAVAGKESSAPSNIACATPGAPPPPEPPAAPTGLGATASGTTGIDLAWTDASANEDGFRVERRTGQTGTWAEVATTSADATAHADGGLLEATEYCYRVSAFNGVGASDPSDVACATTETAPGGTPVPVVVPTNGLRVRLVANDLPGGEVGTWPNRGSEGDAVQGDAARRPVYQPPSPEFNGNASVGFNEGGDNDELLEIGGVATHASGTLIVVYGPEDGGASSSTVFAPYGTSNSRTNMPTSRFGLTEPMDYSTTTMRAWLGGTLTPAAGQSHVAVWRTDASALTDLQLDGEPAGSSTTAGGYPTFDRYLVGMAQPSSSERFDGRVAELLFYDRALLECEVDQIVADMGARYGVVVSATGEGCNPPGDPTGLATTVVGYDGIDLAWTDGSANEDGFRVERRTGQTGAWAEIATKAADVTAHEDRGLLQQTEYCYRVSAFNDGGSSAYTEVACATTEEAPPGACVDTGNHDDLTDLYGIVAVGAPANQAWASTQLPACEITPWYFGIDSGVDSDHPDLNVVEAVSFVAAEPGHDGEDRNGHGTHTAGSAAARDGNGGVVGVAPGARIHSFRVCEDGGSCQTADMVAAMDEVITRKLANPGQPMVANMSIGGPADAVIDQALRNSINAGIVYAVAAGNGILGACIFPADASNVSPARVGDDAIAPDGSSSGNDGLVNGVITTTSHDNSNADVNCNYGAPVSVAAPGYQIRSTWLNGGYNTISGTSMATPHSAGAALLYLQRHPEATPAEVEEAILSRLQPWSTNEQPNAAGRLFVDGL